MWHFPNSVPISLTSFSPSFQFQLSSSRSFLQFVFSNDLFQPPHVISSNQLWAVFPVRHSYRIFPIRGQLFHSYNLYQMTNSQFFQIPIPNFPNSMPLISLMSCTPTVKFPIFSFFSVSVLLLSNFHRSFSLSPNHRAVSHHSAFPLKLSFTRILLKFQSSSRSPRLLSS